MQVEVTPLWFQNWWFQIGAPALLLGLLAWILYGHFQRLRKRERTQLEYRLSSVKQEAAGCTDESSFYL